MVPMQTLGSASVAFPRSSNEEKTDAHCHASTTVEEEKHVDDASHAEDIRLMRVRDLKFTHCSVASKLPVPT